MSDLFVIKQESTIVTEQNLVKIVQPSVDAIQVVTAQIQGPPGQNGLDGASTLAELTDVDLSEAPQDGQVLKYSQSLGKWVPAPDGGGDGGSSGGGPADFSTLDAVTVPDPEGDFNLVFDTNGSLIIVS